MMIRFSGITVGNYHFNTQAVSLSDRQEFTNTMLRAMASELKADIQEPVPDELQLSLPVRAKGKFELQSCALVKKPSRLSRFLPFNWMKPKPAIELLGFALHEVKTGISHLITVTYDKRDPQIDHVYAEDIGYYMPTSALKDGNLHGRSIIPLKMPIQSPSLFPSAIRYIRNHFWSRLIHS